MTTGIRKLFRGPRPYVVGALAGGTSVQIAIDVPASVDDVRLALASALQDTALSLAKLEVDGQEVFPTQRLSAWGGRRWLATLVPTDAGLISAVDIEHLLTDLAPLGAQVHLSLTREREQIA